MPIWRRGEGDDAEIVVTVAGSKEDRRLTDDDAWSALDVMPGDEAPKRRPSPRARAEQAEGSGS